MTKRLMGARARAARILKPIMTPTDMLPSTTRVAPTPITATVIREVMLMVIDWEKPCRAVILFLIRLVSACCFPHTSLRNLAALKLRMESVAIMADPTRPLLRTAAWLISCMGPPRRL